MTLSFSMTSGGWGAPYARYQSAAGGADRRSHQAALWASKAASGLWTIRRSRETRQSWARSRRLIGRRQTIYSRGGRRRRWTSHVMTSAERHVVLTYARYSS